MAFIKSKYGGSVNTPTSEFIVDTMAELEEIDAKFGDTAIVIEGTLGADAYIKGTNGWKKINK